MEKRPSIGIAEYVQAFAEAYILVRLVSVDKVGPVMRWFFRLPVMLYRVGLGPYWCPQYLMLTTTGRKSGRLHVTALEYNHSEETNTYVVSAGWGGKTDWFRNAMANPFVSVQVRHKIFKARAEICPNEDVGRQMYEISRRTPVMDRVWARWSDQPLDGTLESYEYAARFFPSLRLFPIVDR